MTVLSCDECDRQLARADAAMVRRMLERLVVSTSRWKDRLRTAVVKVCPACDAYALGAETTEPIPFYSHDVAAFLTVHDWDWWNDDPASCDIREWPDFGCLTFSEAALRSAVRHLQTAAPVVSSGLGLGTPCADFMAMAGIPLDRAALDEWAEQLRILQRRMGHQYSIADLDEAVRGLIAVCDSDAGARRLIPLQLDKRL